MFMTHFMVYAVSSYQHVFSPILNHYTVIVAGPASASNTSPGGKDLLTNSPIAGFLKDAATTLFDVGAILCIIGIIVGGIMRATAFGSERRIAASNLALSCAVLGFLIILLAQPIGNAIQGAF